MKTKLLLLSAAFMLYILPGFTQVTLTFANSGFVPGDNSTQYSADTTGITPGTTGASHTWNFGSLAIGTTTTVSNYVLPSTTPSGASYPTATVAAVSGTSYEYFTINSSSYTVDGTATSSATMIYTNTEKVMSYPFAYTNNSSDNFACTFTSSGTLFYRTATISTTADGWGTLVLPSGSHSTLRVDMVQNIRDSSSYGIWTYVIDTYMWYDGVHKTPLLEINLVNENIMGTIYAGKTIYVEQSAAGIEDYAGGLSAIHVYPNPSTGLMTISVDSKETTTSEISILDVQGKTVKQINDPLIGNGANQFNLDITDLPVGIYFARIATPKGMLYKKLVKE